MNPTKRGDIGSVSGGPRVEFRLASNHNPGPKNPHVLDDRAGVSLRRNRESDTEKEN